MRALARAYLAVSLLGALHAIRRHLPARPVGWQFPGTPRAQALTIGTPLSAPPAMLVALLVAIRMGHRDAIRLLSLLFLLGIVAEADTPTTLRAPFADPFTTGCTALEIVLPIAMLVDSR